MNARLVLCLSAIALLAPASGCQRCGQITAKFPLVVVNATLIPFDRVEIFSERKENPSVEFSLEAGQTAEIVVDGIVRCNDLDDVGLFGPTRTVRSTIIVVAFREPNQVASREVSVRNDEIERIVFREGEFRTLSTGTQPPL